MAIPRALTTAMLLLAAAVSGAWAASPSCAELLILAAAKKNVAQRFGNAPESGGRCAYGVRTSLELSRVGGVDAGLGNAIDYLDSLPPHGFVDSGVRDPNAAVPGSVIVFSGPYSARYLATGHYGIPAGDWLGHVTIKGDDGYYYTDGRTAEPALGWENGRDVEKTRVVSAVFTPDPALTAAFAHSCPAPTAGAAAIAVESPARAAGHRLAWSTARGLGEVLALPSSDASRARRFAALLEDARRAIPYDQEGALAQLVARALAVDADLRSAYDAFLRSRPASDCLTRALASAVSRAQCLQGAGQDDGASCPAPPAAGSCGAR